MAYNPAPRIYASDGKVIKSDDMTGSLITVDMAHHECHEGSAFQAHYVDTLGNGASYELLFVVADTTKWPHMLYDFLAQGGVSIGVYEGPAVTGSGTPVSVFNRNRNSLTANGLLLFHTPTTTADGTLIWSANFGAKGVPTAHRGDDEYILKQAEKYLIRVTNATAVNNLVMAMFNWYETTSLA